MVGWLVGGLDGLAGWLFSLDSLVGGLVGLVGWLVSLFCSLFSLLVGWWVRWFVWLICSLIGGLVHSLTGSLLTVFCKIQLEFG